MKLLLLASVLLVGVRAQGTCTGRCYLGNDFSQPCQCDYDCETYENCCQDFWLRCRGTEYGLVVTQAEMNQFVESLWENDVNRISSDLYKINPQNISTSDEDKATERLIVPNGDGLDAMLANRSTTYPSFIALLNNYNLDSSRREVHPDHEIQEEIAFWDAISKTKVVDLAFRFLVDQGYMKGDIRVFHTVLNEMWFEMYPHNNNSLKTDSGFEHVITGEFDPSQSSTTPALLTGFHNWVRFYEEEKRGTLNYMGNTRTFKDPDIVNARFTWQSSSTKTSSFFIGTSPEFDLCLYTVCAVIFPNNRCIFALNGQYMSVITSVKKHGLLSEVTSAFPVGPRHGAAIVG